MRFPLVTGLFSSSPKAYRYGTGKVKHNSITKWQVNDQLLSFKKPENIRKIYHVEVEHDKLLI